MMMRYVYHLSPLDPLPPMDPRVCRDLEEHVGDPRARDSASMLVLMIRGTRNLVGSAVLVHRSPTEVKEMGLPFRGGRGCLELREFQILPRFRGAGHAQTFLHSLLQHANNYGLPVKLDVWRSNKIARHCYEKVGFHRLPSAHTATKWINDPQNLQKMYNITPESLPLLYPNDKAYVYTTRLPSGPFPPGPLST